MEGVQSKEGGGVLFIARAIAWQRQGRAGRKANLKLAFLSLSVRGIIFYQVHGNKQTNKQTRTIG